MRAALVLLLLALPSAAGANGAFPDTGQLLLPRPGTIVLGTNFGLVISEDDGKSWRWSCEHGDGDLGDRYNLASGSGRLVGLSPRAVIVSEDLGCTWKRAGEQAQAIPFDFFPEPADPTAVVALVNTPLARVDTIVSVSLARPQDAPRPLYQAPREEELTTVEVAASDPRFIYATQNPTTLAGARTRIVRSEDRGQTWTVVDPLGSPENINLRIASVDPADPRKLYFRAGTPLDQGDALLLSEDGGNTVRSLFATRGGMVAFLQLKDGTALLSLLEGPMGRTYRLNADGTTTLLPAAQLRVRALAERDGVVYAATDNLADGYAVGISRDRGETWTRLMAFEDIRTISTCGDLPGVCLDVCTMLANRGTLPMPLCRVSAVPDAGAPGEDAARAADASPTSTPDAASSPAASAGCGCEVGARPRAGIPLFILALALLLTRRRRPRP